MLHPSLMPMWDRAVEEADFLKRVREMTPDELPALLTEVIESKGMKEAMSLSDLLTEELRETSNRRLDLQRQLEARIGPIAPLPRTPRPPARLQYDDIVQQLKRHRETIAKLHRDAMARHRDSLSHLYRGQFPALYGFPNKKPGPNDRGGTR